MVAAHPVTPRPESPDDPAVDPALTHEEREAAADPWLARLAETADAWEKRNPGAVDRVREAREVYGADFEREAADFEAGKHPAQRG
jgi:hypothetical protein